MGYSPYVQQQEEQWSPPPKQETKKPIESVKVNTPIGDVNIDGRLESLSPLLIIAGVGIIVYVIKKWIDKKFS